jgi:AraC-like DNA-binding protein
MDEFPYHQHPEFEITYVISGNGKRVTDDFIEEFEEGEVVLIPPDLPHGWVYDKTLCAPNGMIENAAWQFNFSFLHTLETFAPEFMPIVMFYRELKQCIVIMGDTAKEIKGLLHKFENYTEPESVIVLLKILYMIVQSSDYKYIGNHVFNGNKIHRNKQKLQAIYKYIVENYQHKITLSEIAEYAKMNRTAFCLFFKKATNEPFAAYLISFRLQTACTQLVRTNLSIKEICFAVGFNDVPYFNRIFKKQYGVTPSQYRTNMQIELIF